MIKLTSLIIKLLCVYSIAYPLAVKNPLTLYRMTNLDYVWILSAWVCASSLYSFVRYHLADQMNFFAGDDTSTMIIEEEDVDRVEEKYPDFMPVFANIALDEFDLDVDGIDLVYYESEDGQTTYLYETAILNNRNKVLLNLNNMQKLDSATMKYISSKIAYDIKRDYKRHYIKWTYFLDAFLLFIPAISIFLAGIIQFNDEDRKGNTEGMILLVVIIGLLLLILLPISRFLKSFFVSLFNRAWDHESDNFASKLLDAGDYKNIQTEAFCREFATNVSAIFKHNTPNIGTSQKEELVGV